MKTDMKTILEGFDQLQKTGYKRPQLPQMVSDLAQAYYAILKDLDAEDVAAAFTQAIKNGVRWWPKPGELRSLALEHRRGRSRDTRTGLQKAYSDWEAAGMQVEGKLAPCPVCDSMPTTEGRLVTTHDRQRHREAGIRALEWP